MASSTIALRAHCLSREAVWWTGNGVARRQTEAQFCHLVAVRSLGSFLVSLFFLNFGHTLRHIGPQFSQPGIELVPTALESEVLTTGPPGKS